MFIIISSRLADRTTCRTCSCDPGRSSFQIPVQTPSALITRSCIARRSDHERSFCPSGEEENGSFSVSIVAPGGKLNWDRPHNQSMAGSTRNFTLTEIWVLLRSTLTRAMAAPWTTPLLGPEAHVCCHSRRCARLGFYFSEGLRAPPPVCKIALGRHRSSAHTLRGLCPAEKIHCRPKW